MNKTKLEFDYDYDFFLIGIFCHHKDYRLAWMLNKYLELDLSKSKDYVMYNKDQEQKFSMYVDYIDNQELYYYLISNRGENGLLIPERKDVDYFLMVDGLIESSKKGELVKKIRELKEVLSAIEINPAQLNSKQNLLIE
ncbi:MAG: IPExxxVDY family protein [Salibacteraceae bacterium]